MKRRWKHIFAGLLAALTLCLSPCFAEAAQPEDLPAVKAFQHATSGMCIEEFNRYDAISVYRKGEIKFETTDRQRQSCEGIANRPSRMAEKEIQLRRAQEEDYRSL